MKKTKKAKETAGMRIEAARLGCKPHELGGGNLAEARRIDRVIARTKRKAREEVLQQFTAHARNLRAVLHGNKDIHAVEHWRQCIQSFEREMKP